MATDPNNPQDYGNYELVSAQLLALPALGDIRQRIVHAPVAGLGGRGGAVRTGVTLGARYHPYAPRRRAVRVALPPAPPVSSIGVMDVGQGNCNLLLSQATEPLTYFDVGYPLWFFVGSLPNTMRAGNAAYMGPIMQNTAGNLNVVLSHWDWDHWRLGAVAGLQALAWEAPLQPVGPATLAFCHTLANLVVYNGAPFTIYPNYVLHQCVPPMGAPAAILMNNSGIAMGLRTNLPTTDATPHYVYMTGDANFNTLQAFNGLNISGIEAVHHGSNNHGAAANLPVPAAAYAVTGRIFYSYGLRINAGGAGVYAYGFPGVAALAAYQAAGWNNEMSPAEWNQIRALPPTLVNRGNLRVGGAAALNAVYNYSAFFAHAHVLN